MSRMNESCHVWMSHVTYEWVMSRMNESCHISRADVPCAGHAHWALGPPKQNARKLGGLDGKTLHYAAVCCCVLLCVAVCCSVLQCVAVEGRSWTATCCLVGICVGCVRVSVCLRVHVCVWERERERVCVCVCVCVCECACVCLFVYVCAGARVHPPARAWERVLPYARALEREYCPMVQGRMDKALYTGCVCKRTLTSSTPIWRKDAYVNNEAVVGRVCWACYSVLHCVVMCMRVLQRAAVPRFDLGRVGWF